MSLSTYSVLAYHGCDASVADEVTRGSAPLAASTREYDWLGEGTYFWLGSYRRAMEWALFKRSRGEVTTPAVLCAEIELGNCLNLTDHGMSDELQASFSDMELQYVNGGKLLPRNGGPKAFGVHLFRNLDCAVIRHLHHQRVRRGEPAYDTVLGAFEEGAPAFLGSCIREKSHIQLAVRTPACIVTLFRLP